MEEKRSEWHVCLGYFNINSVAELTRSVVEDVCNKDPERSAIYWHAYWYLKDRPTFPVIEEEETKAAFEWIVGNLVENVKWPVYRSNYQVGEWGRPTDIQDTVGYALAHDPKFARNYAAFLNQTSWFGNNSRIRKGG